MAIALVHEGLGVALSLSISAALIIGVGCAIIFALAIFAMLRAAGRYDRESEAAEPFDNHEERTSDISPTHADETQFRNFHHGDVS
jgi:hypothetical protein